MAGRESIPFNKQRNKENKKMKNYTTTAAILLIGFLSIISLPKITMAQQSAIPLVMMRDYDGFPVPSTNITRFGRPTLLVFYHVPAGEHSEADIETIIEARSDHFKHHDIRVVLICVNCDCHWTKAFVNGHNFEFDSVLIDQNSDLIRGLMCERISLLLLDETGQSIYRWYSIPSDSESVTQAVLDKLSKNIKL
jgi:hypothetical protein